MHNIINIKLTRWLGINHSGWALQSDGSSFFFSDIDATYENFIMVWRVVQNFFCHLSLRTLLLVVESDPTSPISNLSACTLFLPKFFAAKRANPSMFFFIPCVVTGITSVTLVPLQ